MLQDPHRLSPYIAKLPTSWLAIAALFDGRATVPEICRSFQEMYGVQPSATLVEELHAQLSKALLLNDRAYQQELASYRAAPRRSAHCAGGSYPDEAGALRRFLDEQRSAPEGPGASLPRRRARPLLGLISPHIDLYRGGPCYAWGWGELAASCPAHTFIVLGTSHYGCASRFCLTRKEFETPLGAVPVEQRFVDTLLGAYQGPEDLFAEEIAHKGEHSIEFQALHLAYHFGQDRPLSFVPILCGSLHELVEGGRDPGSDPAFRSFLEALRVAFTALPAGEAAVIAGVDFGHVGSQFDQVPLTLAQLEELRAADLRTLELISAGGAAPFHSDIARDGNARQICGHAPITALLSLLEPLRVRGELLKYDAWYDGRSAVSFASMVFPDPR